MVGCPPQGRHQNGFDKMEETRIRTKRVVVKLMLSGRSFLDCIVLVIVISDYKFS